MNNETAELLQGMIVDGLMGLDDLTTALRLLDRAGWVTDEERGWTRRT